MALSAFSDRFAAYDSTPVENLFLLEYMPHAPGDYVRVYLYGLMQCHHPDADASLEGMARVLNLKPEQVLQAFRYWEQKGLVVGLSDQPPRFEYLSVRSAMMAERREDTGDVYQYRDFNNKLQSLLGLLHPQQFQKAMEWVEDLKLPADVVLLMVREKLAELTEGGARKRSLPYLFKAFDQQALMFAEHKIFTIEKAERELSRGRPAYKLAVKVLDYLSLRRSPTAAEVELAEKWLGEWQLNEKAVMAALKQTASSANPSFAYLDRILMRHRGTAVGADVGARIEQDAQLHEALKQLLNELGSGSRVPSEDQKRAYLGWLEQGFEPEVLVRAAVRCNRSGRRSFDQLELELIRWHELGITTIQKTEEYNKSRDELRRQVSEVFNRAGIDRRPTESDLDQLKDWLHAAPMELVLFAAECAHGLKLPQRSMQKNLREWASKGITDVELARQEKASRTGAQHKPAKPKEPKQADYQQRNYQNDFFEDFFTNPQKPTEDQTK
ncbi:DnaD domain protein [Eubacteriales bacterium OttesenSCG-928-N13]|nr:DnaD domain protein [Eubacteriales bacterium OttesenSCG-928-N13]